MYNFLNLLDLNYYEHVVTIEQSKLQILTLNILSVYIHLHPKTLKIVNK